MNNLVYLTCIRDISNLHVKLCRFCCLGHNEFVGAVNSFFVNTAVLGLAGYQTTGSGSQRRMWSHIQKKVIRHRDSTHVVERPYSIQSSAIVALSILLRVIFEFTIC